MRQAFEDRAELLWSFESADGQSATFVALLGEQVIAFAKAHFGRTAVYLGGAGTRPDQRGRGAYTALVRARWEAAVERGTPVLTVGAGCDVSTGPRTPWIHYRRLGRLPARRTLVRHV